MRNMLPRFLATLFLLLIPTLLVAQSEEISLKDFRKLETDVISLVKNCMSASVGLGSKERPENGSAVVVSKDGLVLTAYHVIAGLPDEDMIVSFVDGKKVKAKKLGGVPRLDIAMVQITDEGEYPFVEIGDMSTVDVGDWCVSISHSAGFQSDRTPPVRLGRVVNKNRNGFLQITSTLIGGDSGGPTFDINGKVIGIHSNIGGSLIQNQACPISDFTKDDHWKRLKEGEVWGKGAIGSPEKQDDKKTDDDESNPNKATDKQADEKADGADTSTTPTEEEGKNEQANDPPVQSEKTTETVDQQSTTSNSASEDDAEKPVKQDTEKTTSENVDSSANPAQKPDGIDNETTKPDSDNKQLEPVTDAEPSPKAYSTSLKAFEELTHPFNNSIVRFWRRGRQIVSGTIVTSDGLIVTKSSELMSRNFEVELPNGDRVPGRVVKRIPENDLLFVKVDSHFPPVNFDHPPETAKEISAMPLGSLVVAVGYQGKPVAMGVRSVQVRNLSEAGYAVLGVHLGTEQDDLSIKRFTRGSAARKSGMRRGDRIVKINQETIENLDQLRAKLHSLTPNTRVPIEFEREGRVAATLVKLGSSIARADQAAAGYPQGGRLSRKRLEFTDALQTDTPFAPKDTGTPLVDLQGRVLGLNIARAGRIKSYTLPGKTIMDAIKDIQSVAD